VRRSPILLVLPLLAACESATGIPFPDAAVRVNAPAIYRQWWAMTEACAGRKGDFDAVSWYVVPGVWTIPDADNAVGVWYSAGNRIVLAEREARWGDVVRHEMLHALLGKRVSGHPRAEFVGKCGGVVDCADTCLQDGGPPIPPQAGAVTIDPSAIEVNVAVTPSAPSSDTLDGYFSMIVTARNPATHPVVVRLPESGDAGPPPSFSFRIGQGGYQISYDMRAEAPEVTQFAPGETKQFVFDLHNVAGPYRYDMGPASWSFNGAYGWHWARTPAAVVVAP